MCLSASFLLWRKHYYHSVKDRDGGVKTRMVKNNIYTEMKSNIKTKH